MRIVLAGDERIENTRDVRIGELVFVALVDKLVRGVDKERRVILLALFQNNDAGGDADPEKEVGGQLDDGVDVVVVDEVFADFLFRAAAVEYAGELDDGCRAVRRQPRKHVHRKGEIGFALRRKDAGRREPGIVDQERILIAHPLDRVGRVGNDALERLVVPMFRREQRIAQCDIELLVVDIVQEHIDAA